MNYYGKQKFKRIEKRELEYKRCDSCNCKIKEENRFYRITTGHHDWGNDSIESIEYKDICCKCINKFIIDYLKENEDSDTAYINVKTNILYLGFEGDYDQFEDRLVENDNLESEVN